MMAQLINKTKNILLVPEVRVAEKWLDRLVGLLSRTEIHNEGLWIESCNSVHTLFMRFSIDLAFVDTNMQVKAIHKNVKPWRLVLPVIGADSVFELPSGTLSTNNLQVGDHLDVT